MSHRHLYFLLLLLFSCRGGESPAGATRQLPPPPARSEAAPPQSTAAVATVPSIPDEPFPEGTRLTEGSPLPQTPLLELGSKSKFDLATLQGKAVLVNLWATWCTPCRAETPELAALWNKYRARGLEVAGISVDTDIPDEDIRHFVNEEGAGYRMLRQPGGELMQAVNTPVLPTTILLDRSGKVRWLKIGPIRRDDPRVIRAIETALQ